MDTSAISYRVADFLKKHPPFHAVEERDLLELAGRGRVRFYEANEYILWQGEPHKLHVFVIQQGTVSLWDEADGDAALRDVRGAGDMLGIERFTGAPFCLQSARSASDVVIYAFPASDFEALVLTHPYARRFVEAYDTVAADYQWASDARDPQALFLHNVAGEQALETCTASASIRDVAQSMLTTGCDAIAVVNAAARVEGVATVNAVLGWVAAGGGSAEQPIGSLLRGAPPAVGSTASVTDGLLTLAGANADALALTSDGSAEGRLQALVTPRTIGRVFGDQPLSILTDIQLATSTQALRALNHRARALALQYLTSAPSIDWLTRFASLTDVTVVKRLIALAGGDATSACWCVCGASGREESLTRHAPQLVLLLEDERERPQYLHMYERVCEALSECDYLDRADLSFDRPFLVASVGEWRTRYEHWLGDPVRAQMYLARPFFDLRAVHGPESLWRAVETTVIGAVDSDLLQVLANDCLASLPPLTFFQDAVIEDSGEHAVTFRLEHSALRPLVDVGRVFGLAAKRAFGTSTRERLASARSLLPEHESIFRDASETLRILLWQQARIGIAQGTSGSELPPALLSRHDRHVLKSAFRSILRLVEFTGNATSFGGIVTIPPFVERYRTHFDGTWADDTPIDQVRFVVLDSETTGLDARTDRIITIGAVAVCGHDILLEDSFDALLQVAENTSAVTVHGVTRDETRGGLEEEDALARFLDYLRDGVIVGHHIGHDISALDAGYERAWGVRTLNRSLDTMDLTLHLERDGAFAGRPPIRHFTLDALCDLFQVIPHDRHTASGDAFITAQVFLRLLRLAGRHGRTTLGRLCEPFVEESAQTT